MSSILPKEKQSAYQRWELASFGDDRPSAAPARPASPPMPVIDLAEQIAHAREEARRAGYAAGLEEGRAAGLNNGRLQAEQEFLHLQQIAATFGTEVEQANQAAADELLDLALDLAKALLKTALAVRPELIIPLVGEAIRYLPSLQQPALLFLHPEDAVLVKDRMGEELAKAGWRVAEDLHLERGGCRVETASNQIDASISTRWQRLASALSKDLNWLEP